MPLNIYELFLEMLSDRADGRQGGQPVTVGMPGGYWTSSQFSQTSDDIPTPDATIQQLDRLLHAEARAIALTKQ
jgi:hypothetical protein